MKTMGVTVPRRRGFAIAWSILVMTVRAYLRRESGITFEVGEG